MNKSDTTIVIGIIALVGFALWQNSKKTAPAPKIGDVGLITLVKTPAPEQASISLDVWQGLTGEQLAKLPVTTQTGELGGENYYKTSQPVAIGNTGFKIWGMTESGVPIVALRDPSTYDISEWY